MHRQCPSQTIRGRARVWNKRLTAQQKPKADPTSKLPGPTLVPSNHAVKTANSVATTKAPADNATAPCGVLLYAFPTVITVTAPSSDATATQK